MKLSTLTTGRVYYYRGIKARENLADQFTVLSAVKQQLGPSYGIIAPQQLIVIRTPGGNYIKAEELMAGWTSLSDTARDRGLGTTEEHRINEAVKARIRGAVGHSVLRLGLQDLGLRSRGYLHSTDMLVQDGAEELGEGELCLIDQPIMGVRGRLAATLLSHARQHPNVALQPIEAAA